MVHETRLRFFPKRFQRCHRFLFKTNCKWYQQGKRPLLCLRQRALHFRNRDISKQRVVFEGGDGSKSPQASRFRRASSPSRMLWLLRRLECNGGRVEEKFRVFDDESHYERKIFTSTDCEAIIEALSCFVRGVERGKTRDKFKERLIFLTPYICVLPNLESYQVYVPNLLRMLISIMLWLDNQRSCWVSSLSFPKSIWGHILKSKEGVNVTTSSCSPWIILE